jgi:hypothetical protein
MCRVLTGFKAQGERIAKHACDCLRGLRKACIRSAPRVGGKGRARVRIGFVITLARIGIDNRAELRD